MPTLKIAASGAPSSVKGGFPVAISTTVQPRDHMSACREVNHNMSLVSILIQYPNSVQHRKLIFRGVVSQAIFIAIDMSKRILVASKPELAALLA